LVAAPSEFLNMKLKWTIRAGRLPTCHSFSGHNSSCSCWSPCSCSGKKLCNSHCHILKIESKLWRYFVILVKNNYISTSQNLGFFVCIPVAVVVGTTFCVVVAVFVVPAACYKLNKTQTFAVNNLHQSAVIRRKRG